ncbi:MAG TPA: hypothetical protein PK694_01015 [Rhodospirillales bacterium]|nr:hypothetical protein [Rhodospirillales bacterium]
MNNKRAALSLLLSGTMMATLAFAAPVTAAEEETAGNNLSFPTKFIPSPTAAGAPTLRLACGAAVAPTGSQCMPDYWCQKTDATWQADCTSAADATVHADWGDNLISGRLRAGKPIRVEMNLIDQSPILGDGYMVEKLTDEIDRLATYGTNGTVMNDANFRVFDSGARVKIECTAGGCLSNFSGIDTVMPAEVNSMGNIVYGYNWGTKGPATAPKAGTYKITFTSVKALISGGEGSSCGDYCRSVIVNLVQSGGGAGGGQGGGAGGKGGGGGGRP